MTPRQRQRGAETVERLLTAALDVYADRGPGGFTVTAVTAASGVSLGSLYHHFGTFDGLAAALYSRCLGQLLDRLVEAVESADGAEAGIRAAVSAYLGFVRAEPAATHVIHLSGFAPRTPDQVERLAAVKGPRIGRLLAWLRPHTRSGQIVDLPDLIVEMLLIGPPAELARRSLTSATPGVTAPIHDPPAGVSPAHSAPASRPSDAGAPRGRAGGLDVDHEALAAAIDLLPERVWLSLRGPRS